MVPASGWMKPSHISTVVVLPAPFGSEQREHLGALHVEVEVRRRLSSTRTAC